MQVDGVDISKIKRPVSPGRKPTKPRKPSSAIKAIIKDREVFWKLGKTDEEVKLLDALKNIPKNVPLEDCLIWTEEHGHSRYNYTKGRYLIPVRVCVGRVVEKSNPKYITAWAKFKVSEEEYEKKVAEHDVKKKKYESEMRKYKKYRDVIDFHSATAKVEKQLAALEKKLQV